MYEYAKIIGQNIALIHLRLKGCDLGDELVSILAQGLPSTRNLVTLNLSRNKIGNRGATSLALGLMKRG
jgi:hypothetical protein